MRFFCFIHRFFNCECVECSESGSVAEAGRASVRCSFCGAGRPLDKSAWQLTSTACPGCGSVAGETERVERYRALAALLAELESGHTEPHQYNYLAAWCAAMMGEVYGARDIEYIRVCHYVHTVSLAAGLFRPAVLYGEIVLPGFEFYYGRESKMVAALLVSLHEARQGAGQQGGQSLLTRALDIYSLVPGQQHPLWADIASLQQIPD